MDHEHVDPPHLGKGKTPNVDRSQLGKGEYADYFEVGHDFVAFYLDCGQQAIYQGETTRVYSRIATSPIGAINLLGVLAKALCAYSRTYHSFLDDNGQVLPRSKEMGEALCEYVERFVYPRNGVLDQMISRLEKSTEDEHERNNQ
jgi:hypothetical protein